MTTAASPAQVRVLIADDHKLFAELLHMGLSRHERIQVVGVAHDGARALELATALAPDVTLMDILMPVMDGFEATQQLLQARPGARVIMLSGVVSAAALARALEIGAARCMTKEALAAELVATILDVAGAP